MVYQYGLEKKIQNIVDDIKWIPNWGRDREHEWLKNMGDWMISKKGFGDLPYLYGYLKMDLFL